MHAVIRATAGSVDFMAAAKALAAARGTPVQDQIHAARASWGILAENLSEPDAASLAERLNAAGLACLAVAQEKIAVLPEAVVLNKLEPVNGGWTFHSAGNQTHAVEAAQLAVIAAAGIKVSSSVTTKVKEGPGAAQKILSTGIMLATGLPIKIGGKDRTVDKTRVDTEDQYTLDLVTSNPIRHFRIAAAHFDYAFLKERKLYVSFGNFKLLLSDLIKASPTAATNHGARVFLANQPQQTLGYASLADLDRESRWILTLARG